MNILKVLESGRVARYHSTLIEKKQPVSDHSWEVAIILKQIYPTVSGALLFYALTHDAAEIYTSDLASPVKRANPNIKKIFDDMEYTYIRNELGIIHPEFSTEEMLAVKYADILSGIYFTKQRCRAGDMEAQPILEAFVGYYKALPFLNYRAGLVLGVIYER